VAVEQIAPRVTLGLPQPASSSASIGSSKALGFPRGPWLRRPPGMRWGGGDASGINRAQGLPALASTIVSPAWAWSIRRDRWVLA